MYMIACNFYVILVGAHERREGEEDTCAVGFLMTADLELV